MVDRVQRAVAVLKVDAVRNVRVLDRDEPGAFAWPNGEVVVTRGLVSCASDSELAAAIAHEIGHLRHADEGALAAHSRFAVEAEADDVAIRLLVEAGLPADALSSLLRKLAADPAFDASTRSLLLARAARLGVSMTLDHQNKW